MYRFEICIIIFQSLSILLISRSNLCAEGDIMNYTENETRKNYTLLSDQMLPNKMSEDQPSKSSEEITTLNNIIPGVMIGGTAVVFAVVGIILYRMYLRRADNQSPFLNSPITLPDGRSAEQGGITDVLPKDTNFQPKSTTHFESEENQKSETRNDPMPKTGSSSNAYSNANQERKCTENTELKNIKVDKSPDENDASNKKRKTDYIDSEQQSNEESIRKKLKVERSKIGNSSDSKPLLYKNTYKPIRGCISKDKVRCEEAINVTLLTQFEEQLEFVQKELVDLLNRQKSIRRQMIDVMTRIKKLQGVKIVKSLANPKSSTKPESSVLAEVELQMEKFLKEAREFRISSERVTEDKSLDGELETPDISINSWSSDGEVVHLNTSNWSQNLDNTSEHCAEVQRKDDSSRYVARSDAKDLKCNNASQVSPNNPPDNAKTRTNVSMTNTSSKNSSRNDIAPVHQPTKEKYIKIDTIKSIRNEFHNLGRNLEKLKKDTEDTYHKRIDILFSKVPGYIFVKESESDSTETISQTEEQQEGKSESLKQEKNSTNTPVKRNGTPRNSDPKNNKTKKPTRKEDNAFNGTENVLRTPLKTNERRNKDNLVKREGSHSSVSLQENVEHISVDSPKPKLEYYSHSSTTTIFVRSEQEKIDSVQSTPESSDATNSETRNFVHNRTKRNKKEAKRLAANFDTAAQGDTKSKWVKTISSLSSQRKLPEIWDVKTILNNLDLKQRHLITIGWSGFKLTVNMFNKMFYFGTTPDEVNVYMGRTEATETLIRLLLDPESGIRKYKASVGKEKLTREQIIYVILIHWALIKRHKKSYKFLLGAIIGRLEYCFVSFLNYCTRENLRRLPRCDRKDVPSASDAFVASDAAPRPGAVPAPAPAAAPIPAPVHAPSSDPRMPERHEHQRGTPGQRRPCRKSREE